MGVKRGKTTDLVRAEQGPAEVPSLCRGLGLGQPLLGYILMLHVWIKVQLVESLDGETHTSAENKVSDVRSQRDMPRIF